MGKQMEAFVLGTMCFILTIAISVQIRTVNNNGNTVSSNQQINNLKTQVLKMKERYEESFQKLENAQEELETARTNVTKNDEKLKSLEENIKENNILLGATEVTGPGVTITLTESNINVATLIGDESENYLIHDGDIREIVNELKNAGAEAIEVNGQRITNQTAITCDGNIILINGEKVGPKFTINAIGYAPRLATLKRTGGILQYLEKDSIKTTFTEKDKITISKYTGTTTFKFASTVK